MCMIFKLFTCLCVGDNFIHKRLDRYRNRHPFGSAGFGMMGKGLLYNRFRLLS